MQQRVLLAEDDPYVRNLLDNYLRGQGYRVVQVEDGNAVLPAARFSDPNLILLDVLLPGMDGLTVLRNLSQSGDLAKVPVVVLSVLCDEDTRARARSLGAAAFLCKPFSLEELDRTLQTVLK